MKKLILSIRLALCGIAYEDARMAAYHAQARANRLLAKQRRLADEYNGLPRHSVMIPTDSPASAPTL